MSQFLSWATEKTDCSQPPKAKTDCFPFKVIVPSSPAHVGRYSLSLFIIGCLSEKHVFSTCCVALGICWWARQLWPLLSGNSHFAHSFKMYLFVSWPSQPIILFLQKHLASSMCLFAVYSRARHVGPVACRSCAPQDNYEGSSTHLKTIMSYCNSKSLEF